MSPSAGYIQTPDCCDPSLHTNPMDSVVWVKVPAKQRAMVSTLYLSFGRRHFCDASKMTLALYETSMAESNRVWLCWVEKPVQRRLIPEGADLFVRLRSQKSQKGRFKLLFSVHERSTLLQQESNGAWNCSVPSFQQFKPHFPCDLQPQCVHKEDERDCPYFSEDCGVGFVTLGGHCLVYISNRPKISHSWREKEIVCERRGMRMASFRRQEDFERMKLYLEPLIAVGSFWNIAVGIHSVSETLPLMYRNEMQNSDGSVAFYRSLRMYDIMDNVCGFISYNRSVLLGSKCSRGNIKYVLCEISRTSETKHISQVKITLQPPSNLSHSHLPLLIGCPQGYLTRDFLACDFDSACWSRDMICLASLTPCPPTFACDNGFERVAYTMVCDVRPDCSDGSDETFCVFPPCDLPESFHCSNHECVSWSMVCDGQKNCYNGIDENLCSENRKGTVDRPASPAIVHLSRQGEFTVHKLSQSQLAALSPVVCPETHFQCPVDGYCVPVFLRCNGVVDCPGQEDEADCVRYTCPGFYHCRGSKACLHPQQLCDGIFQCPENDDELLCDLRCPENCTCYGLAWYCSQRFNARAFNRLRFLDCRGSGMEVSDLLKNALLIHLGIAENRLASVAELNFPNLRYLDLNNNQLTNIQFQDLSGLPRLKTLSLSGNPLLSMFQSMGTSEGAQNVTLHHSNISEEITFRASLRTLDLSGVKLNVLNTSFLFLLPNLHIVNMSGSGVDTLLGEGFQALTRLRILDFRGCPLSHFPRDIFQGLQELELVRSDNYKLCCSAILPADFVPKNCHAPSGEISSCEALLGSNVYRVFLSVFAFMSLLGNAGSFLYRMFMQKKQLLSFQVFVAHLNIANLLMGVYLSVIVVADRTYLGNYLWEDNGWMNSVVCTVVGFLSLVSSEVSAFVISCITVDRFLVLRFPLGSFRFGIRSAHVASCFAWSVGCLIASVPIAPGATTWQFYGRTGICAPLPVDITHFPVGFGVIMGINIVFFIVIGAGQTYIYWSVHNSFLSPNCTIERSQDVAIARRLISVAMSDFLCWFPCGLVELLAATGTPISVKVNVAMAIFVLPVNSALNPFLYTFNVMLEKSRIADEDRVRKRLMAQFRQINTHNNVMSESAVS